MKYIIFVTSMLLCGCFGNYIDLEHRYGVVQKIESLTAPKCNYEMMSGQTLFDSYIIDTCGKYQIGDTIKLIVSPVQPTTAEAINTAESEIKQ